MKSILELLNESNNIESTPKETAESSFVDETEAQDITEYSTDKVAELLKQSVDIHWQQAMELTGQGVHLNRWGYRKLGDLFLSYGKEELEHASIAIDRLEFFDIDYQPISVTPRVWQRHDVKSIIEFNLEGVNTAAKIERAAIAAARLSGDEMTSQIIIPLLKGSDDGVAEFEKMLKLIEQMGIDNFLTLQV
jgi:bacterioferritin (cytochrome b1)